MTRLLCAALTLFLFVPSLFAQDAAPPKPDWSKKGRGYKPMDPREKLKLQAASFRRHGHLIKHLAANATPPAAFDAVTMGWVAPVFDQGNCGSCYEVSSADGMTGAFIKQGWGKNDGSFLISAQYGLDCHNFGGCNGGDEAEVIDWMKNKGYPAEKWVDQDGKAHSDYGPYTARPSQCQLPAGAKLWQLEDYGFVGTGNNGTATVDEIKVAVMTYGQLSIALDAGAFNGYQSGVIKNLGTQVDHAITLVGWDDSKNAVKCRNNWSAQWGEQGYCWIDYSQVPKIVEVIWLKAPALPVPPGPVPPGPVPPGPVPPGPTPFKAATVDLTPDQVAAIYQQQEAAGVYTIHGDMTLRQLADIIAKATAKHETIHQPVPCCGNNRLDKVEQDAQETKRAVDAIMRLLLKQAQEPTKEPAPAKK